MPDILAVENGRFRRGQKTFPSAPGWWIFHWSNARFCMKACISYGRLQIRIRRKRDPFCDSSWSARLRPSESLAATVARQLKPVQPYGSLTFMHTASAW